MLRIFRHYKILVFGLALVLAIFFLAHRGRTSPQPRFFERWAHALVSPLVQSLQTVSRSLGGAYRNYIHLTAVRRENIKLKEDLQLLRAQLIQWQEDYRSLNREWGESRGNSSWGSRSVSARVVGHDPKSSYRSITLDIGSEQGVRTGQTVVSQGGLVGQIIQAGPKGSRALLIDDLRSVVDVLDVRTRARGSLTGRRKLLSLGREYWLTQGEYFSQKEEIQPGDLLITTGMDEIFPKGIPAGTVRLVEKGREGVFLRAEVQPYVELNKLENVQVLVEGSPEKVSVR